MAFQTSSFFPTSLYDQITEVRVKKPDVLSTAAERRAKPDDLCGPTWRPGQSTL